MQTFAARILTLAAALAFSALFTQTVVASPVPAQTPAPSSTPVPSPIADPYAQDPLHIVAHMEFTTPPANQVWKVYACDVGTGYYLPDPVEAVQNWGPAVTEWFRTASGGMYNPTFSPMDTVLHDSVFYECSDDAFDC